MNRYRDNRVRLDTLVAQAELAVNAGAFAEAVAHLATAATFACENHTGLFLDRRIESLLERVARHVNAAFAIAPRCTAPVGFLMTSIHTYGGHSKIAWRWMQLDRDHRFQLVLTAQHQHSVPEQLTELLGSGRVTCAPASDTSDVLTRIRDARDQLAGADMLVMNTHPDDVVGATVAACLRETMRIVYIDHAFFSFSLGMPSAHALCCTSPAAAAIATQERLVSPEHLVWYRNSPEWLGQDLAVDSHALRATLGVPEGVPLLLSSGTEHKFYPLRGMNLLDLVAPVLDQSPEAHLVLIGIWRPERLHGPLFERYARRLHLLRPVSERELMQYIASCDIYLDSVPNHSGGAAQQAMLLGKPALAYADPQTYLAHLAPQFFSLDDFSWIHFSSGSYQADLAALLRETTLRRERGQFLQAQVSSRISERDNIESIHASYRKARQAPLIAQTLLNESWRVENPALHRVQEEIARGLAAYKAMDKVAPPAVPRPDAATAVRAIAFYLPQFHAIPQNNAWWGEGFTEWTNVRQARPLFEGHEQPLEPSELGYYDLSDVTVMARQAQLAKDHGIHGFCFHYYWFDGQRLLEKPVDQLLQATQIDLPFCLCWANENWTRRWDGGEHEVLMQQSYSPALNERFARDLLPYFSDSRYIRIADKPVLLVYRTDIIPDLSDTVAAWRAAWREAGLGEVYLIAVESFKSIDPRQCGFDAASEFPPHQVHWGNIPPNEPVNLVKDCNARVGDYKKLSELWLKRPRPDYKLMRALVPSWDNTSRRRKGGASLFLNATPAVYEDWLAKSVAHTLREFEGEERLVFVNAWNEWAEGCTLEPTVAHGRAYLEATRRVMRQPEQVLLATVEPLPSAYQQWLAQRPDRQQATRLPGARALRLCVALAEGDATAIAKTRLSLQAQTRPPDGVVIVSQDAAWPHALDDSNSSWALLLTAGDTLEPDALEHIERAITAADTAALRVLYTDHDELDANGMPSNPSFKPDFNHDLLLSYPYIGRALVVRTRWAQQQLAQSGGRLDLTLAYRLALQALAEAGSDAFHHLAVPLLHLTPQEAPTFCSNSTDWQALAGVLDRYLKQAQPGTHIIEGPSPGTFHAIFPLTRSPLVSIVIPTRDQLPFLSRCVESLLANAGYANFEILIVDNDSQTLEAQEYLVGLSMVDPQRIRVLRAPGTFNFSRMNNLAVREARGEFILMLNNDTAALQPDWLEQMVRNALREEVGVVGARLVYPDGRLQHAGVILGLRGPAEHPFLGLAPGEPGYMFRAQVQQNFSVVTAACLLVKKVLYESLGGLDEDTFSVSYNDVDFCLRVGQTGKLIVWTPLATLLHEGSASQKASIEASTQAMKVARFTREQAEIYQRWPALIANDPAYNPNLSLAEHGYEIETNSRLRPQKPNETGQKHILAFAADADGCGQYRILQPLQAMIDAGLCTGGPSPELMPPNLVLRSGADTLVFQRPNNDAALDMLEALIPLKGIRKIYEVDDHISRIPLKSAHHQDMPKDMRGRINRAIGLCDRLVVSTEALAHELAGRCGDTRVVQNRLSPAMWGALPPGKVPLVRQTSRPRVGWAGGIGHLGDLEMIAEVIRDLADTVDWVFFGMCPDAIRPFVREFHTGVPTLDYPARLMQLTQSWDLAIAPLEINAFNECKSNLKLLEYGWCGVPVVCTDITPYQCDLPATRVKNRYKDWREAILSQLADRAACQQQGQALQERVAADWTLTGRHLTDWYQAWTD